MVRVRENTLIRAKSGGSESRDTRRSLYDKMLEAEPLLRRSIITQRGHELGMRRKTYGLCSTAGKNPLEAEVD